MKKNVNFNSGKFATIKSQTEPNRTLSMLNDRIHADATQSNLFHLRLSAFICG